MSAKSSKIRVFFGNDTLHQAYPKLPSEYLQKSTMEPENSIYSYTNRDDVLPVSWDMFHGICKGLAAAAYPYNPDIVIGIARGGMYPGTLLAHILRKEFYPIRLTRRENDVAVHNTPKWLVEPLQSVAGKKILVVDEISDSGETLSLVQATLTKLGATNVQSAVMYAHTKGQHIPQYIGLISDALILNPWDFEIYTGTEFALHPEYARAFEQNNLGDGAAYLPNIKPIKPQKQIESR